MRIKRFNELYHHESSIDNINVGDEVEYKGKEYLVKINTGERVDLKPKEGGRIVKVYHYNTNEIKRIGGGYY